MLVQRVLLAAVMLLCFKSARSHEPVIGTIDGILLIGGKPIKNAIITGCKNITAQPQGNTCREEFNTRTDRNGKFSFNQATGFPPCTVCPCTKVGGPIHCDPTRYLRFTVSINGESEGFEDRGMGYGIVRATLVCEWNPKAPHNNWRLKCDYRDLVWSEKSNSLPESD